MWGLCKSLGTLEIAMITTVLIDSREPETITRQQYPVPAIVTMLATGDVWVTTDADELLVFERKTPSDLLDSIPDGRLFNQVCAMREQSDWAYLVITGRFAATPEGYVIADGRETRWRWESLQGVLAEVQERGVTVWYAPCDAEFAHTVQVIAKRDRQGVKPISARVSAVKVTPSEAVLMALPGIGYERAKELLEVFAHVPILALVWLTDLGAIGDVSNIGKATKRNVRKALGMSDDMDLALATAQAPVSLKATVMVEPADPLASRLVSAL